MKLQSLNIVLSTTRLYLREFGPDDAPLLFDLDSDQEVMRFITKGEPTPLVTIENEILPRILSYHSKSPRQGVWAAHLREDHDFVGWFHLRPDKLEPSQMELGYRLKRCAWGRGLATEGSIALVHQGFTEWGCSVICARTLVGNVASRRVMEKAGLQFETEFCYGLDVLPGWSEAERRAVKYSGRQAKEPLRDCVVQKETSPVGAEVSDGRERVDR